MRTKNAIYLLSVFAITLLVITACQSPEVTSAKVYFQQENLDAAEEQLLIALDKEPMNPEVPYLLASGVYGPRRDYDKAKEMVEKAAALDPTYTDKADQFIKKFWADIYSEGANFFNSALKSVFPAEKDSLLLLATEKFEKSLTMKDDEISSYNGLAKCFFMLQDTAKVIDVANRLKAKDIFDKDTFFYYGQVIWTPGNQETALAELQSIANQYPEAGDIQLLLVGYLSDLERYDEALEVARTAAINDPDNLDISFILAQIYGKIGDFESAQFEFQKVLASNPDDVEVLVRISEAYFNAKDYVMAEEYSRRAVELSPDDFYGYDILWKSLYNQGKLEEAEEYREIEKTLR